jgi:hypothetical protein
MVFERNEFSEKGSLDGKRSIPLKAKHLFFFLLIILTLAR